MNAWIQFSSGQGPRECERVLWHIFKIFCREAEDENIQCLYGNLLKGSRNHLRSFYNKLVGLGIFYTPQFLSEEDFYAIVNTPHETGGTQCNF